MYGFTAHECALYLDCHPDNRQALERHARAIKAMNEAVEEVAKESAKKLRQTSPKRTGEYARNWAYQKERGRLVVEATVYGKKPTYRLAHLLEKSHLKRNGQRWTPDKTHIEPVAEWAQTEAVNRMYEKLEKLYR